MYFFLHFFNDRIWQIFLNITQTQIFWQHVCLWFLYWCSYILVSRRQSIAQQIVMCSNYLSTIYNQFHPFVRQMIIFITHVIYHKHSLSFPSSLKHNIRRYHCNLSVYNKISIVTDLLPFEHLFRTYYFLEACVSVHHPLKLAVLFPSSVNLHGALSWPLSSPPIIWGQSYRLILSKIGAWKALRGNVRKGVCKHPKYMQ